MHKSRRATALLLSVATAASHAQNPMNAINAPDPAPGTGSSGTTILLVIAIYVFFFWLVFKGPLKNWAAEHTGGAWALLAIGPIVVSLIFIMWS